MLNTLTEVTMVCLLDFFPDREYNFAVILRGYVYKQVTIMIIALLF